MAVIKARNISSSDHKRSNNRLRFAPSKHPLLLVGLASTLLFFSITMMRSGMMAARAAVPSPKLKQAYKLLDKKQLSPDSFLLRYGLSEGRSILGLDPIVPTCIKVYYEPEVESHKALAKSYSPVSHPSQNGYFELVVKSYPYQEGGGVGKYICDMEVGSSIHASLKGERVMHGSPAVVGRGWKNIGLVAGGTGIAPLLQVARIALESAADKPRVHLLFVNHKYEDILGKDEIEALAREHPDQFFVTYSFTQEDDNDDCPNDTGTIKYVKGKGDVDMVSAALPEPSEAVKNGESTDTMVLLCGRDGFVEYWAGPVGRAPTTDGSKGPKIQGPLLGVLAEAGFTADQVFKY